MSTKSEIQAYSSKQPRAVDGKFGSGGASKSAHSASQKAKKSGSWVDHGNAGFAHQAAASKHRSAGNHGAAKAHDKKASQHFKKADRLLNSQGETNMSTSNVNLRAEATIADSQPTSFEILAYTGGKLHVDGFDLPVVVDLNGLEASGEIPIAIKHDTGDETILGQTDPDQIENTGTQLKLGGPITADPDLSPRVKRILAMAAKGHKWQASIGARIEESHEIAAGETVHVNGQDIEGPFILATEAVLRETSVLGMGADNKSSVSFAAGAVLNLKAESKEMAGEGETTTDDSGFETWVTDVLELDPSTLNEQAKDALMQQYAAQEADESDELDAAESEDDEVTASEDEGAPEGQPDESTDNSKKGKVMAKGKTTIGGDGANLNASIAKSRKLEAAELRRKAAIKKICGSDEMLCAAAIEKGWSVEKAENQFLKRQKPQAPAGHVRASSPQDMLKALQGAMILRAGGKIDHPGYGGELGLALDLAPWLRAGVNSDQRQKAMEAAWKFRDMSMVDLCRAACQIDGGNSRYLDGSNKGFIRAAISGGSLADIFTTNINAVLIDKLIEAGDTTVGWTREADANNFQPMERTRLVKGGKLSRHARGGTADSATRSDIMESYKISRYSQLFKIDEMDMIDDAFGALKDIPIEMAEACARLRPDLVYSILFANGNLSTGQALFSTTQPGSQANLFVNATGLNSGSLQTGMSLMFNFLENGVGLNIYPTHILVPMVLAGLAFNLLEGQNIALAGTAGTVTERGDVNPLAALQRKFGKIEVVSDQRLTNGVVDPVTGTSYAGSSTTWRLASNRVPTIEVAYLKGSGRAPSVRQFQLDQGQWGVGWDVNLDIGAKALEWRGLVESRTS